jgi:hypothetical protein
MPLSSELITRKLVQLVQAIGTWCKGLQLLAISSDGSSYWLLVKGDQAIGY